MVRWDRMPAVRAMLTLADREEISRGLAEGLEYKQIARLIGRNPSVVSRDVARHGGRAGYRAVAADQTAAAGRQRPKAYAVDRSPRLRAVVTELLRTGWSPASIAGRLPPNYRDDQAVRVSHEAIYQLDERPAEVEGRQVPGRWQGDLVIGKAGTPAVATLVERVSRFVLLVPLSGRDALTVDDAVIAAAGTLPPRIARSVTCDCGAEMAGPA